MSREFFFNNKHITSRSIKTNRVRIVKRDLSGEYGVKCDRCNTRIYGDAPYSIKVGKKRILFIAEGVKTFQELPNNPKDKAVEILAVGGIQQSDFCHACLGSMKLSKTFRPCQ